MSTTIIKVCDRCKTEEIYDENQYQNISMTHIISKVNKGEVIQAKFDLCDLCLVDIIDWIKNGKIEKS